MQSIVFKQIHLDQFRKHKYGATIRNDCKNNMIGYNLTHGGLFFNNTTLAHFN